MAVMDARSKARQSSIFAGKMQLHRPSHGKCNGSYFAPLQLVEKSDSYKQGRNDSYSHNLGFRGQMSRSMVSRGNTSVVGRVVGVSDLVELSQMSCSQSSVMEHHDSMGMKSNHSMLQPSQRHPPLHQSSALSNSTSRSSGYSRSQQIRLPPLRSNLSQRSEECDAQSHCNSSTHITAGTSLTSMPAPARSVQSKKGSFSTFFQRMNPRRIGSSTTSLFRKPGEQSTVNRDTSLSSHLLSHPTLQQSSATSLAQSTGKTSSSSNSSFLENMSATARINETQQLSRLQSELKVFVDKSMQSIQEKSTELDRKQSQLEEESKNRQRDQNTLFEGRLHELSDAFDSKADSLNRLFDDQKSNLKSESAGWIHSIRDAGDCQMQRLSQYSQATLKKFHDAAKTTESFLSAYKQTHTDAIQALPNLIRPILSKMMNSMLPSALSDAMVADATPSGSFKASSDSSKSTSNGNKSSSLTPRLDTCSREPNNTKKRRGSASRYDTGPSQTATGPNQRLRRSKRIKYTSDKENLTPTSKTGKTRPCVTPGGSPKEDHIFSINSSIRSPSPKKVLARRAPKNASASSNKKRKIARGKSTATPLKSKRIPFEVELTNLQFSSPSSPLTQASAHHQSQRNISRPKGSNLKRKKPRQSYGKASASRRVSLSNDLADDMFSFVY